MRSMVRARAMLLVVAAALWLLPQTAFAHAVLTHSTPERNSTVKAGDVAIVLTYNSRVDRAHSTVVMVGPAAQHVPITLDASPAPNVLTGKAAHVAPGAYTLQWQVLSLDGHMTRGTVAFRVN